MYVIAQPLKMKYKIERDEEYLKTWLQLNGFSEFDLNNKIENTTKEIEIVFLGTEDLNISKPSEPQINALNFIINNSENVLTQLSKFIYSQREELEEVYGQFDKEEHEGFPDLTSENDVCKYLDLSTIYIHEKELENISYIGLYGNSTWDSEHGFGTIFHKDRIVDFGDWYTAYSFYEEKNNLSISEIYSLTSLSIKRNQLIESAKNIQLNNLNNYLDLFDWLINKRAIYGYRSTKVDLTDKEKIALIIDLEYLDLSGICLEVLPNTFSLLEKVRYLGLRNNKFKILPNSISDLKNLESLDISINSIYCLQDSFSKLTKLNYLNISMNKFNEFPSFIKKLQSLENIDASDNELKSIPDWIGELSKLKEFRVSNNNLKELPKSIGNIKSLEILYAMGNKFSFFQRRIIKNWLSKNISYDIDND